MLQDAAQRYLVLAPAWIGDTVLMHALIRLLRQQNPTAVIDVLGLSSLASLVSRMSEVREFIPADFFHGELRLVARYRFGKRLRERHYDVAYFLPNSFKSVLIPKFAHIPCFVGYARDGRGLLARGWRYFDRKYLLRRVDQYAALALPEGEYRREMLLPPQLRVDQNNLEQVLIRFGLSRPTQPLLILCPGGSYANKRWLPEYFAAVARAKLRENWLVWILGGVAEQEAAVHIRSLAGEEIVDLTGKTSLADSCDLCSLATLVVANDTSLMHIAAAVQRPIVAIYGATPEELAPPLTVSGMNRTVALDLPCRPCRKPDCRFGHRRCLCNLAPELVLGAMNDLMGAKD